MISTFSRDTRTDFFRKVHEPAAFGINWHAFNRSLFYILAHGLVSFEFGCKELRIAASNVKPVNLGKSGILNRTEVNDFCACKLQQVDIVTVVEIESFIQSNTNLGFGFSGIRDLARKKKYFFQVFSRAVPHLQFPVGG